jgi:hypothetical protein
MDIRVCTLQPEAIQHHCPQYLLLTLSRCTKEHTIHIKLQLGELPSTNSTW